MNRLNSVMRMKGPIPDLIIGAITWIHPGVEWFYDLSEIVEVGVKIGVTILLGAGAWYRFKKARKDYVDSKEK